MFHKRSECSNKPRICADEAPFPRLSSLGSRISPPCLITVHSGYPTRSASGERAHFYAFCSFTIQISQCTQIWNTMTEMICWWHFAWQVSLSLGQKCLVRCKIDWCWSALLHGLLRKLENIQKWCDAISLSIFRSPSHDALTRYLWLCMWIW